MNRQRKVVITVTYNDLGMIVDTKAEELNLSAQPNLQPTCNQLATDLISREDAIKRFGEDGTWLEHQGVTTLTMVEAKQRAVDILESLPSADRPTGWVPVTERLPENGGCVLISIAGDIEFGAYDRQNSDWAIWCDSYWNKGKRADAWMPLPKPYREDGE